MKNLEWIIGDAISKASMLWDFVDKAGEFKLEEGCELVEDTIKAIKEAGYKHKSEFEKLDEQKVFSLIEETLFLDGDRFGKSCICGKFDLAKAICAKFSKSEIKYPEKTKHKASCCYNQGSINCDCGAFNENHMMFLIKEMNK